MRAAALEMRGVREIGFTSRTFARRQPRPSDSKQADPNYEVTDPLSFLLLAACCTISGTVHAVSGAALAAAQLVVRSGAASDTAKRTTTDSGGGFSLDEPPGTYTVAASAKGFAPVTVFVNANRDVSVQIALEPLDSPKLRQIGTVTIDGRLSPIQGTIPSIALTRADLDALGDNRIVEGLEELPSATFTRPDGGAASAVAVVSLRGPDPSESLLALDGQLLNDGKLSRFRADRSDKANRRLTRPERRAASATRRRSTIKTNRASSTRRFRSIRRAIRHARRASRALVRRSPRTRLWAR